MSGPTERPVPAGPARPPPALRAEAEARGSRVPLGGGEPGGRQASRRGGGTTWTEAHSAADGPGRPQADAAGARPARPEARAAGEGRARPEPPVARDERAQPKPGAEAEARAAEAAEAVARHSYGRLVASLAVRMRDVASAEDALAEAFAAALADWPKSGVPDVPEAWLLTVARRKGIDAARRRQRGEDASDHLKLVADELAAAGAAREGAIPDERLALVFACAHPAIDRAVRAPLVLQTLLGFDAKAIGSAFLVSPTAMAQRLVRAKRKIKQAGIPFAVPEPAELPARLDAVLETLYAAFAEGWSDGTGTEPRRRSLAEEALWLARLVVSLLPDEAEAQGLLALMLYAWARRDARRDASGEYVPLAEQDPAAWDAAALEEAEALLARASRLPATGRYQLEAAVQSAHLVRRNTSEADWPAIEGLYDALFAMTNSPVVAVNRAVAIAETRGPEAGLTALTQLDDDPRLATYQPFWAARADLLARTSRTPEADEAYTHAIGLEPDPAVRRFLERRRAALQAGPAAPRP